MWCGMDILSRIAWQVKEQDQKRVCDGAAEKDTSCPTTFTTEDRAESRFAKQGLRHRVRLLLDGRLQ